MPQPIEHKHKQCNGKNIYTKHEAHRVKKYVGIHRDKDMRVYECPSCRGWHLTKRNYD